MNSDIFCKLYSTWKQEGKIIFENHSAYSIFSVTPVIPGHAIVISKPHVERIEQLRGADLESFVDAFSETIISIQKMYDSNPEKIIQFYESLKKNPPTPTSAECAERMLENNSLKVKPDMAYNIGINVGHYAGQLVNHLHAQIFPRRKIGLGIVSAMEALFRSEN